MRKTFVIAVLLSVLLISGTAWAAQPGNYLLFGAGQESCGQWTKDKKTNGPGYWQLTQWVSGYLTAYSRWVERGQGPVSEVTDAGGRAWVDNYCRDNPLDRVAKAAARLIVAIEAN